MEDTWRRLAGVLVDAVGDLVAEQGHPIWVKVMDPAEDDGDFALEFVHTRAGFVGWRAPADCQAVGVVATGRAHVEQGPAESPVRSLRPGTTPGLRVCCVVARDGRIGWRMVLPNGESSDDAPESGRILDCLRRCFGLPTPPPPQGAGALQSVLWLTAVLNEAEKEERRLPWRAITRLHPVAGALELGERAAASPADMTALVRVAARAWTWTELRLLALDSPWTGEIVSPEMAAWMDDGMFARWVLDALPDPEELLARVRPLVAPSSARRLGHLVRVAA